MRGMGEQHRSITRNATDNPLLLSKVEPGLL